MVKCEDEAKGEGEGEGKRVRERVRGFTQNAYESSPIIKKRFLKKVNILFRFLFVYHFSSF